VKFILPAFLKTLAIYDISRAPIKKTGINLIYFLHCMPVQVQKLHTFTGHRDCIYTIESSGDASVFFSASGDGMVVKWNLSSPDEGELIARLPNSVYAIHRMKESDLLVVGNNFEGIHLLNWRNKKEIKSLKLSSSSIFDIQSFHEDLIIGSAGRCERR
jgi:WD40 repeat protein